MLSHEDLQREAAVAGFQTEPLYRTGNPEVALNFAPPNPF